MAAKQVNGKLVSIIIENLPKISEDQDYRYLPREILFERNNRQLKKVVSKRPSQDGDTSIAGLLQECIRKEKSRRPDTRSYHDRLGHLLNDTDDFGMSAVHLAAASGLLQCVRVLVEAGASVGDGHHLLRIPAMAGWLDIIQYLLQAGSRFDQEHKDSIIMCAGSAGHVDCFRALLEHNKHTLRMKTPEKKILHNWMNELCEEGQKESIKVLSKFYPVKSLIDNSMAIGAICSNDPETLRLVWNMANKRQRKNLREGNVAVLMFYVYKHCKNPIPMLKVLVFEFGCKPDWNDTIIRALRCRRDKAEVPELIIYIVENRELFGFSLNTGISPTECCRQVFLPQARQIPLHFAVQTQCHALVEFLLNNGAWTDIPIDIDDQFLELDDLTWEVLPHTECLSVVIQALMSGLDESFTPQYGRNSLLCAVHLLRHGCPVHLDLFKTLVYILTQFKIGFDRDSHGRFITDAGHYLNMPPFGRICLVLLRMLFVSMYKWKDIFGHELMFAYQFIPLGLSGDEWEEGTEKFDGENSSYTIWSLHVQSAFDCGKTIDNMDQWEEFFQPCSLVQIARDQIRSELKSGIPGKVNQLPIPDLLKSYLNLSELDDLVSEYDEAFAQALVIRKQYYHPSTLLRFSWLNW